VKRFGSSTDDDPIVVHLRICSVGSTSVATKVHMLYLCIGGNSCCSMFYDSELHISFVRARGCGLRH
jgi:hypothetical protein